jgi:peptidoglycan hydrolase-like protein with peptidoglycan-binding domain
VTAALVLTGLGVGVAPAAAHPEVGEIGLWSTNQGGVKCVQHALNRVAGAGLVEDGIYGPLTQQAVRNFQGYFNINEPRGVVFRRTGDVLWYTFDLSLRAGAWKSIGCWARVPSMS